jgi:hypothetical protein
LVLHRGLGRTERAAAAERNPLDRSDRKLHRRRHQGTDEHPCVAGDSCPPERTQPDGNLATKFLADFTDVTKEVTTAVACGKILDRLAPTERPTEPGATTHGDLAAQEAVVKMASRRWPAAGYQWLVDWTYYIQSVKKDAHQFAQNIGGYSTDHLDALGNLVLRKAVLVYLRTCYTPPESVPVN